MPSPRVESMLYKEAQEARWESLGRPAFISRVNRGLTLKTMPEEDVLRFRKMIMKFDKKGG